MKELKPDQIVPPAPPRDPWVGLAGRTPARIALGRSGVSLPTGAVLAFALAHARARDAVHGAVDFAALAQGLATLGLDVVTTESDAVDRALYLRRPDYGRRLSQGSRAALMARCAAPSDLALVIGDGLSAAAVDAHALALVAAILPLARVAGLGFGLGPVTLVRGARVAIGDEIGALLQARAVAVLIGERPGLSAPDSLGVYLTFAPRPGRTDAERNCLSNIRPEGLPPAIAAQKLVWLARQALLRGLTGVELKDDSDAHLVASAGNNELPDA